MTAIKTGPRATFAINQQLAPEELKNKLLAASREDAKKLLEDHFSSRPGVLSERSAEELKSLQNMLKEYAATHSREDGSSGLWSRAQLGLTRNLTQSLHGRKPLEDYLNEAQNNLQAQIDALSHLHASPRALDADTFDSRSPSPQSAASVPSRTPSPVPAPSLSEVLGSADPIARARELVALGQYGELKDAGQNTLLHLLMDRKDDRIGDLVSDLQRNGQDLNAKNEHNSTALSTALFHGNLPAARALLNAQVEISAADRGRIARDPQLSPLREIIKRL